MTTDSHQRIQRIGNGNGPARARVYSLMVLGILLVGACATLRGIAALRQVRFDIDRVAAVRLAGIDLSGIRSFSDIRPADLTRLTFAIASNNVPLTFDLHLRAENPADNATTAQMLRMTWALFLDDRETISGVLDRAFTFPPGEPVDVPIAISLDLAEHAQGGARDFVDLVLSATGLGGRPIELSLRATPEIDTTLGPIRYPEPITILSAGTGR